MIPIDHGRIAGFNVFKVSAIWIGRSHCRHGRRRTFGRDGQKWSSPAYNGPSSTLTLNNPFGESAVGRSTFMFSFIQRQHSEPSQPTSECLQVARQRCLDRAHNGQLIIVSFCGSEMMTNCTLTEFRRRCLSRQNAASTGLMLRCLTRYVFIFRTR